MSKKEYNMISEMWDIIGDLPISRAESMGYNLYHEVGEYLGWFEDEDEDDDDFIDSDIEIDEDYDYGE